MSTPICDFVQSYLSKKPIRLHMPGHKGDCSIGPEAFDITEITGADSLYTPLGIIDLSENNAGQLFGTQKTLYSTEGSSLAIRTMLYLIYLDCQKHGKKPLIAAARNVHKSFIYSVALLDFDVNWLYSDTTTLCSCVLSPDYLDKYLLETKSKPCAIYITSPDYLGNLQDIASLSKVCKKHNVYLLVDNAHGAYTKFLEKDIHPITLGADMCCDSAHKTLPVLTGGAYLHISKNVSSDFCDNAKSCMAMFASTSPSYLILQSLDKANDILASTFKRDLKECISNVSILKKRLYDIGYNILCSEDLKIVISTKDYGYFGKDIANYLEQNNIFAEFYDKDFIVFMFSPCVPKQSFDVIYNVLSRLQKKQPIIQPLPTFSVSSPCISIRQALMSPRRRTNVSQALGKILTDADVSCPPAIPIAICGERITQEHINSFIYYEIHEIFTVQQ